MTVHVAEPSQDVLIVDLKTAARMLGIGESAVRKRLGNGALVGEKDDKGHWISVTLPQELLNEVQQEKAAQEDTANAREIGLLREFLAEKDRAIEARERENEFLRQRVMNLETLLAQSLQQYQALMPPAAPEPEKKKRAWWQWSSRED
jgi:hypothetical protein